jgi:hypothetical protein
MKAQVKEIIEKSQNIHIFLPENYEFNLKEGDVFCAGSALFYTLKKLGKKTSLFFDKIPQKFSFLAKKKATIFIKTKPQGFSELSYEKTEEGLKIHLDNLSEKISSENISLFSQDLFGEKGEEDPDLIVTLGAQSIESLGDKIKQKEELFNKVPVLNIDNNALNERFGEVNYLDIKKCSISSIVTEIAKSLGEEVVDKKISHFLLAGITWASENFRNSRTRPETFKQASFLIESGADHQEIIKNFYKTKTVSQIKLLGEVLKKIKLEGEKNLNYVGLSTDDFKKSGSTPKDLGEVLQELKFNFGRDIFSNFLILWESRNSPPVVKGIFCSPQKNLSDQILKKFQGSSRGDSTLFTIREKNIEEAKRIFLKETQ